ncbi:ABC transporter substrate-binding protein [Nocardiopsis sp. MG754419]|uniref:ABC transporter substrate-binding protein n=1 Tax=Nocardiopsis sp. MG754419 TaxID=2259865 RepID=UPI001BA736E8|nr:ABC transporter substrate-binding protein [Nocardiopsis sp. MG754419]MBR8744728.1 myristoyl transferase [Nocardiopsis sp. MG754419]
MPAPSPHRLRLLGPAAALTAAALLATACGGGADTNPEVDVVVDGERCETNRDAGPITFVTGYHYQASVTQLEVIAAEALGYFDALCLDVEIQPGNGDLMGNAQLVSAGTARFTAMSNEAEVLQADTRDHEIVGIATYGHVPISTLLTGPDVDDLTELEGRTLGHQSLLPAPLEAMLVEAGVDVDSIDQVEAGYDPSVLPRGQVQALTGFRSNEPHRLDALGEEYTQWLPEDFGVVGSFGVLVTDPVWAEGHPTATEDFLRAVGHAFDHCSEAAEECVGYAADLDRAGYDAEHNLKVWDTERALVTSSTPEGEPRGFVDLDLTEREAGTLVDNGELDGIPDTTALFDTGYLEAVHDGADLVWPGE